MRVEGRAAERRANERPRAHDESQPSNICRGGADGEVVVGRDGRVEGPTEGCDVEDDCGRAGGGVGEEEAQRSNLGWEYAVVRGRMLFVMVRGGHYLSRNFVFEKCRWGSVVVICHHCNKNIQPARPWWSQVFFVFRQISCVSISL